MDIVTYVLCKKYTDKNKLVQVNTYADLPNPGSDGALYLVKNTGQVYYFDGPTNNYIPLGTAGKNGKYLTTQNLPTTVGQSVEINKSDLTALVEPSVPYCEGSDVIGANSTCGVIVVNDTNKVTIKTTMDSTTDSFKQVATVADLPAVGLENVLYAVKDIKEFRTWDSSINSYVSVPIDPTGKNNDIIHTIVSADNKIEAQLQENSISESYLTTELQNKINSKVDKVAGKQLSTNDYTNEDKAIVDGISAALDNKVDKVAGKQLSTNDYTDAEKTKLAGLENYVLPNASANTLGGIKVGNNLTIDENGVLSATAKEITVDTEMSTTSTNPVQNKVITNAVNNKVDKVSGKQLSTEDYTTAEKNKLATLENYTLPTASDSTLGGIKVGANLSIDANGVLSATGGGSVVVDDAMSTTSTNPVQNKVITKALNDGLDNKVDKETGKGLSTNDFTTVYKEKLDGIEPNANNYVLPKASNSVLGGIKVGTGLSMASDGTLSATGGGSITVDDTLSTTSTNPVQNKVVTAAINDKVDKVAGKQLSTEDFTTALKTKLENMQNNAEENTIEAIKVNNVTVAPDGNKIVHLTVPTKVSDLTNDLNFISDANYVHTDNNYTNEEKTKLAGLSNYDDTAVRNLINGKQDTLVSGTNIKTINNQSLLGSGNITIDPNATIENTLTTDITVGHLESGTTFAAGSTIESILRAILVGSGPAPIVNHTVSFNTYGGSAIDSQVVADGETATRPVSDPTKADYTFDDWYTSSAYTTKFNFSTPITADTVVHAKWDAIPVVTHTVSFNTYDGTSVPSQTVEDGQKATRPATDPTKTDYTFDGWYTDNTYATAFDFNTPITVDTVIHAKWEPVPVPVTHTVTFYDMAGGTISTQTINDGDTATKPADPTMTGYTFDNWYSEPTFVNVFNFSTPITADTGVYAKFTLNPAPTTAHDLYIGGFSNAECSTLAKFNEKTQEELLANIVSTHDIGDTLPYDTTLTWADPEGTKNSIYYLIFKENVDITAITYPGQPNSQSFPKNEILDTTIWRATHTDLTIDGETYKVAGLRTRYSPDEVIRISKLQ